MIICLLCSHLLKDSGISDFEFVQLWNLRPRTYKEAVTLVPTLAQGKSGVTEDTVIRVIDGIQQAYFSGARGANQ